MAKRTKKAPPAPPQNGIRELVWVEPTSLDENPLNWRKHPERQTDAIGASIKANGWADTLLFNENTQRLIDGHARRQVAIEEGIDSVPVLIGWWTEEQEKHLLATLDPLGAMAETDATALTGLTEMLQQEEDSLQELAEADQEILKSITSDLSTYAFNVSVGDAQETFLPEQVTEEEEAFEEYGGAVKLTIDEEVLFPSSNDWGIPDLLDDMLSEVVPDTTWDRSDDTVSPTSWFCQSGRPFPEEREGGILGFFTEDYRFASYWNKKTEGVLKLSEEEWSGVCLPDYSVYHDEPFAIQLYNLYRSRWLGRFWQELGIKIIPIIQAGGDEDANECFLETLPKKAPTLAFQCRTVNRRGSWTRAKGLLEDTINLIAPKSIIIYGGVELRKKLGSLPSGTKYIFVDSYMTKRRHRIQENR